jgi:hypothetical protein
MSGPITAGYFIVHGVLLLSMRALAEARAMKRDYGEVLDQLRQRENDLELTRQGQRRARLERLRALRMQAERQHARLRRLRSVAQSMVTDAPELASLLDRAVPAAPDARMALAWKPCFRTSMRPLPISKRRCAIPARGSASRFRRR